MKNALVYHGGGPFRRGAFGFGAPMSAATILEWITPERFAFPPASGDNPPRLVTVITTTNGRQVMALECPPADWGGVWGQAYIRLHPGYAGGNFFGGIAWTLETGAEVGTAAAFYLGVRVIASGTTLDTGGGGTGGLVASAAPAAAWGLVQTTETDLGNGGGGPPGSLVAVDFYKGADGLLAHPFMLGAWVRYSIA